jgi:hypothetical protein
MISARAVGAVSRHCLPKAARAVPIGRLACNAKPSLVSGALRRAIHSNSAQRAQQVEQSPQLTAPQISQTDSQVVVHWGDGRSSTL